MIGAGVSICLRNCAVTDNPLCTLECLLLLMPDLVPHCLLNALPTNIYHKADFRF
jgi:hypothetical protein